MNAKLTASAVFCAALISGCGTAPMLSVPTGEWEEFSQAPVTPSRQYAASTPVAAQLPPPQAVPAVTASGPVKEAGATVSKPAINLPGPALLKSEVAPILVQPTSAPVTKVAEVVQSHGRPGAAAQVVAEASKSASVANTQVSSASSSSSVAPVKMVTTVAPAKIIPAAIVPPVVVAKIAPPLKPIPEQWILNTSDGTLRRALAIWTKKAGWQLVWDASVDVPINASATFEGDFRSVVKRLFQSLSAADVTLSAVLYSGNRVLRVTESGHRAQ